MAAFESWERFQRADMSGCGRLPELWDDCFLDAQVPINSPFISFAPQAIHLSPPPAITTAYRR
jgi:hypothetical protein